MTINRASLYVSAGGSTTSAETNTDTVLFPLFTQMPP